MRQPITTRAITITVSSLLIFSLSTTMAFATDIEHFKGKPSTTIEEARLNLSEQNRQMAKMLSSKNKLSPQDMVKLHQMSYTMENALERLSDELEKLEDELEKIHLASENINGGNKTIRAIAPNYLDTSKRLFE